MLRFFKYFFLILDRAFRSADLINASSTIPSTLGTVHKNLGIADDQWFIEYVVCPSCNSIYEFKDCIITANGKKESKTCCHIPMPNHPQISRRQHFGDIYDGRIWRRDFKSFVAVPHSYLLTINVDWFQPFTHSIYSSGAIYLTVQNLPRNERYKQENVILIGVIPGPKEPHLTINSFLTPLVEDLREFWDGVIIPLRTNNSVINIRIRLALTCVACDIPAGRKVCGFLGHNARLSCNKCLQEFLNSDYSNYDCDNRTLRTVN